MSKQAKFEDFPAEPARFNRRVYGAATAPFAYVWGLLWELFISLVESLAKLVINILWIAVQSAVFFAGCFLLLGILLIILNFFTN